MLGDDVGECFDESRLIGPDDGHDEGLGHLVVVEEFFTTDYTDSTDGVCAGF